ncbi:MAG TPA: hypothetical protein VGB83_00170 [Actinomycetota bacterium]
MRRRIAMVAGAAAVVLVTSAPAYATMEPPNAIGCHGSATITGEDGTFEIDSDDDLAVIPSSGSAAWEGSITTVTHDHAGEVWADLGLEFGPIDLNPSIGSWGESENAKDESMSSGVKEIPSFVKNLPPLLITIRGFHEGDEGRCDGFVAVDFDGKLFGPVALGVHGATILTALMLASAARARKVL